MIKKNITILLFAALAAALIPGCRGENPAVSGGVPSVIYSSGEEYYTLSANPFPLEALSDLNDESAAAFPEYFDAQADTGFFSSLYFGENIFGINLAARYFFDCKPGDLTESQIAVLIAAAKNPVKMNPFENYKACESAAGKIMKSMHKKGIFADSFLSPQNELGLNSDPQKAARMENWFADSLISQLAEDIAEAEACSIQRAYEMIYSKGYKIHATVDTSLQQRLDEYISNNDTLFKSGGTAQAAMVVMDYLGNIKAISGGAAGDHTYNRAARARRQIGSTIKPLSVYSRAIADNSLHFSSMIIDDMIMVYQNGQSTAWPKNSDDRYEGYVTLDTALQKSKNTCAVQVAQTYSFEDMLAFLRDKLHFGSLVDDKDDNDLQLSALALGYLTKGEALHRLTAAYQIFGNGGDYHNPIFYTKVEDDKGNILIQNNSVSENILDPESAYIMNRLLINVVSRESGTGKNAALDNIEVFGKTGTTKDKFFVGGTPEYVGGVFIGEDIPVDSGRLIRYNAPEIWNGFFSGINTQKVKFDSCDSVRTAEYCLTSGKLKGESCKNKAPGYYKENNIPEVCSACS